ncbi:MAG: redoxin domain-containing protein [Gemmatimonadota bacterium]
MCGWILLFPLSASSFALRNMEKGAKVDDFEYTGVTVENGKLSSFAGEKGVIVIYWATWSSRSPAILEFAEKSLRRYEKMGLKLLAVNADHVDMKAEDVAAVKAKAAELALSFPVVLDAGLKGYNAIGIISTPTTLILDKELKVVDAYPGFPSVARDDIPERIDAFLGIPREKRAAKDQYLLDHKPKNYALQYYNMGKQMFLLERSPAGELKRVPDTAIERLDEAIRRDPDFFRPYLLEAIIFDLAKDGARRDAALAELAKREFQEPYERRALGFGYLYLGMDAPAEDHFRILSGLSPGDPAVLFGQAVSAARRKDGAASKKALEALRANPAAPADLGFEPAAFFDGAGGLKPGIEKELRRAIGVLLEIERAR